MKRTLGIALAVTTALAATLATALPASAARGAVESRSVSFGPKVFNVNGKAVAKVRNGVVTWHKNAANGDRWVTIRAQLLDSGPGDGWCARLATEWLGDTHPKTKECNGVWTTRTLETYWQPWVVIYMYTDPRTSARVSWTVNKPAGF
ncbi:hypothetical protein [Nonomuraea jiangxiensis]|uniref:Secreted protein n=1 Tax=Nonomuraea jiangxiensis TaxID=633440 RepID=A0A1G8JFQ1_9ACTN|nr:hypothetical protein [Nonomuraea jiangxiensis]SDI30114.1 hypothetical protein SAMN05421869_10578 [Nonomuraea jiangxiensis]